MDNKHKVLVILRVILMSYIVTGVLLLVLAFILYKCQISRKAVTVGVYIVYSVSTMIGGFFAGKRAENRRFMWGALAGICYFIVLSAASFVATKSFYDDGVKCALSLILCTAGGMIGGMVS